MPLIPTFGKQSDLYIHDEQTKKKSIHTRKIACVYQIFIPLPFILHSCITKVYIDGNKKPSMSVLISADICTGEKNHTS